MGDTGEAGLLIPSPPVSISMPSIPAVTSFTCWITSSGVSFGCTRKFTVATARCGNTFSLADPRNMVGAVVVRTMALPAEFSASEDSTMPWNSHRFASAMRWANGMSLPAELKRSDTGGLEKSAGIWLSSSARMAFARFTFAELRGGVDEWPPCAMAVTSIVT